MSGGKGGGGLKIVTSEKGRGWALKYLNIFPVRERNFEDIFKSEKWVCVCVGGGVLKIFCNLGISYWLLISLNLISNVCCKSK